MGLLGFHHRGLGPLGRFDRLARFRWHVSLVVFGQDLFGDECAVVRQPSHGHDALPFATRAKDLLSDRDPDSQQSDVLDTLGWIHYLIGDSNKAENILRQSMGKAVTASNCYHLAAVLAEMDKLDAARTYLDRAAELRPDPRTKAEIDALADDIRTRRK